MHCASNQWWSDCEWEHCYSGVCQLRPYYYLPVQSWWPGFLYMWACASYMHALAKVIPSAKDVHECLLCMCSAWNNCNFSVTENYNHSTGWSPWRMYPKQPVHLQGFIYQLLPPLKRLASPLPPPQRDWLYHYIIGCRPVARIFRRGVTWVYGVYVCRHKNARVGGSRGMFPQEIFWN